jgi:hypothetical protein
MRGGFKHEAVLVGTSDVIVVKTVDVRSKDNTSADFIGLQECMEFCIV